MQRVESMKKVDIDANHYREHSSVQFRLAEDVLSMHTFLGDECVLDVGWKRLGRYSLIIIIAILLVQ